MVLLACPLFAACGLQADNMRARFLDWAEGTAYDDPAVHRDSILGEQAMSTGASPELRLAFTNCPEPCGRVAWLASQPHSRLRAVHHRHAGELTKCCLMLQDCEEEVPPQLEPGEQFPVIIGTDVIYEPLHAELVANILSRRLAPGGSCILCCGVRIKVGPRGTRCSC